MNKKIIILTAVILLLVIFTYVIVSQMTKQKADTNITPTPLAGLKDIQPGIIVPTQNIKPGELDIVNISPTDHQANVTSILPIEVTFSQPIKAQDVEFIISPEIPHTQAIEGNKLIITPTENFQTATLYTYRINILSDLQKIRMYTFSTAGSDDPKYPDTRPAEEEIAKYNSRVRINYPDIYVQNQTPYETSEFGITGTYSDSTNKFQFRVLLKGPNKNDSRADFIIWLQSLDLTDAQIAALDITYE